MHIPLGKLFTTISSLALLIALSMPSFASRVAQITSDETAVVLGPYMDFIEDPEGALDFKAVRRLEGAHSTINQDVTPGLPSWQQVKGDNIIGGFTDSAYWVKFTVENMTPEPKNWHLEINYPLLDHIEFYAPDTKGAYTQFLAGDKLPFEQRPLEYRNFVFPLTLDGKTQHTYYLRVKTNSSMFIDLWMWPGDSFIEKIDGQLMLYGFLYGIVFLGSLYSFVNAAFQGERMYLYIALGILGSAGYLLGINGFGFQYIWPNNLYIQEVAVPFFMAACFGFALLYSREFLELPTASPRSDKIIVYFARACLVLSLASLVLSYAVVIRVSTVFAICTAVAALWAGVISYLRGNRFARFYMVGWSAVIVGATTFALKSLGLIPANVFTIWSQEFGFACVAIFLTMALSDHFFQVQREHSEEQAKSIKAIKTAEKKYRSLFENAIEGIFQMDMDGRLININKAFAGILGYEKVEALLQQEQRPFSLLCLEEHDRVRFKALIEQEQPKTTFQTSISLTSGEKRWISISIQKIKTIDISGSHYEGAMADITETKKREQAEKQQRMAEASTEAKSLFLANMSHEIRTPMNAIIGFTDLALGRNHDNQIAGYLQKTRMASTNLLGIINDILDFSKIEAGKLEIEHTPFSVKEVFNNLSNIVSANLDSKALTLNLKIDEDIPDKLVGDPLRIGQVLLNLTNNAIKFTSQGDVTVSLELVTINKPEMAIVLAGHVRDTGIGIPEEKLKTLFSSFTQADESTTRKFGGTGLGLSISKQLIEMMGGELWVDSKIGEGSTFHFSFSCKLQDRRQRRNPHFSAQGKPLRVLVVDDQKESQTLIEQALMSLAHKVTSCSNSGEAILELKSKQAEGEPYDVLIADWLMPDIDGITCCKMIKEDPDIHTPRTILITGYDQEEARYQAEKTGIDAYMIKPFRVDELDNILKRVFHDRRGPQHIVRRVPEKSHFEGMRVLLVEDVSMNQELAIEILSKKGIEVSVANNGQEGIDALQSSQFDLVLMDMQMPVMDGCQATQVIRENDQELPIIAMTANAMAGDKQKCLASGMNDYVTKPIDPDELFITIGKWTGAFSATQDKSETLVPSHADHPVASEANTVAQASTEISSHPAQNNHSNLSDYYAQLNQSLTEPAEQNEQVSSVSSQARSGVDIEEGLARCQGNAALYLRFLSDFKRDYADSSDDFNTLLAEKKLQEIADLAHKVKGLAANLGARALAHVAGELQQLDQLEGLDIPMKLKEFDQQLEVCIESFDTYIEQAQLASGPDKSNTPAPGTKGIIEMPERISGLEALLPLVKRQKLDAHAAAVALLEGWPSDANKEKLSQLVEALDNFDFKQAENLVYDIQQALEP